MVGIVWSLALRFCLLQVAFFVFGTWGCLKTAPCAIFLSVCLPWFLYSTLTQVWCLSARVGPPGTAARRRQEAIHVHT